MMKCSDNRISQAVTALLLAAAILLASILAAAQVRDSRLYRQGRLVGTIFTQDSVVIRDLLSQRKNVKMLGRFAVAVTSAYINFELIPVNEAATFVAVYQSVDSAVVVDSFEYQRRNLHMSGTADSRESYERFVASLRDQNHFESVSGDYYVATDNTIRFWVICVAATPSGQIGFAQDH